MAFGLGDVFKTVAGPIIGGLFGREAEESRQDSSAQIAGENRAEAARQAELNYQRQKEFAQHGIQWRVEDARAAGLHPVFSLSGGGAAFANNPISIAGGRADDPSWMADMGQNLGRAVTATMTAEQRTAQDMAVSVAQSQINRNNAEANLFDAQALATRGINPPFPSVSVPEAEQYGSGLEGQVAVKPTSVTSSVVEDPSVAAGKDVGWRRIWLTPHLYAYMPNTDEGWAESWGELGILDKAAIIAHNEARQPGFGSRFYNEFLMGRAPMPAAQGWFEDGRMVRGHEYFDPKPYEFVGPPMGVRSHRFSGEGWRSSGRDRGINWRSGR